MRGPRVITQNQLPSWWGAVHIAGPTHLEVAKAEAAAPDAHGLLLRHTQLLQPYSTARVAQIFKKKQSKRTAAPRLLAKSAPVWPFPPRKLHAQSLTSRATGAR
jgi:hypothetical protein